MKREAYVFNNPKESFYVMEQTVDKRSRLYWLDLARVVAIISVLCNHALNRSFSLYQDTQAEFMQMSLYGSFIKALINVFSRLGVPLFLMVTGSLLLKRDYENKNNLKRFLRHNWLSLFRTTEIWLIIMFLFLQIFPNSTLRTEGIPASVIRFFETLLFVNQETMASMWYMAMILIVYLMIPVISVCIKKLGDKYLGILLSVAIIIGVVIPNISVMIETAGVHYSLISAINISDLFSIYIIYVVIGYWISEKFMKNFKSVLIYSGFVIGLVSTSIFQCWVYSAPIDYSIRYADIGILITSIFLFEIIRRRQKETIESNIVKIITYISRISFGIYFVHICVMTGVNTVIDSFLHVTGLVIRVQSYAFIL